MRTTYPSVTRLSWSRIRERAIGRSCIWAQNTWSPGYDTSVFLVGVIFFLYRLKDIVQYVSLFTLGHSTTLLWGFSGTCAPIRT